MKWAELKVNSSSTVQKREVNAGISKISYILKYHPEQRILKSGVDCQKPGVMGGLSLKFPNKGSIALIIVDSPLIFLKSRRIMLRTGGRGHPIGKEK